jgi:hypothetical protein
MARKEEFMPMNASDRHRPIRPGRPPFENRFGSGEQGWQWFEELEYLGPEAVRLGLLREREADGDKLFEAPLGFAHDWLVFLDRRERRDRNRWRLAVLILAGIAAFCSALAAYPVVRSWI